MPTITQGVTLTPSARSGEMDDALAARLHDPTWLLARQWQFGEFQGEDAGSPAVVQLEMEQAPLNRFRPGSAVTAQLYAPATTPLEALVESESLPLPAARPVGWRTEAGLTFLRLLARYGGTAYKTAYCQAYPLNRPTAVEATSWDADALRLIDLYAGRVPNAASLYQALSAALGPDGSGQGPLPAQPPVAAADQPGVRSAAQAWLRWMVTQGLDRPAPGAWTPSRMEYSFTAAARPTAGEVVLAAPEYHGGIVDWDSFVGRAGTSLGAPQESQTTTQRFLATPVVYRGMPHARLWAFEDARVNLGTIDASTQDVAALVLVEFAMVYGNDWFVVPLEMSVGSLCRIRTFVVRDTFGIQTTILHYRRVDGAGGTWRMYALTPETAAANSDALRESFFLAPAAAFSADSAPLEEVLFLRDEMANMAWGVERVVQSQSGQPLDRYEAYQAQRRTQPPEAPGPGDLADFVYRLGSEVPDYWIPLVPEEVSAGSGGMRIRLRRAAMPRIGPDGISGTIPPRGVLLQPGQPLWIEDEEVPREGARVLRLVRQTRGADGSTHVWIGAHKRTGRGEGSSGLRFDTLAPAPG